MISKPTKRKRGKSASIDAEHALWRKYLACRSIETRNALVMQYYNLVIHIAWKVSALTLGITKAEDLVAHGVIGLMQAIPGFNPDRGIKFASYAGRRIRGAMLDELRRDDWVPRLVRMNAKRLRLAIEHLARKYGRTPTDRELRAKLKVPLEKLYEMKRDAEPVQFGRLDVVVHDDGQRQITFGQVLADRRVPSPDLHEIRREWMAMILRGLRRPERLLLIMYYWQHRTMKEIGTELGVCESRVSQLHSQVIARLSRLQAGRLAELRGNLDAR